MLTAEQVIQILKLEPLADEGGYFRRTWYQKDAGSAIYYLLTGGKWGFSALHSLPTDEIYHYYGGGQAELWLFFPDTPSCQKVVLGCDLQKGQVPQYTAPAGCIQGSRLIEGEWALLGTTMAPAFQTETCVFADRDNLTAIFPDYTDVIRTLTRKDNEYVAG